MTHKLRRSKNPRLDNSRLNRRRFLQLSAAGAGAAALAACAPVSDTAAPAAGGETASSAASSGAPSSVEFWDWQFDPREAYMNEIISAWQENNPDTTLEYTTFGYGDLETRLLTSASAGTNPPFSNVHAFWRPELQRSGVLTPYPDDLLDYDALWSTAFNRSPDTGLIYTSDFCLYTDQVYMNTTILEEAGISPDDVPRSWEEFLRMADELTIRASDGTIERAGWAFNHYYSREWLWTSMVYQNGGFLYSEDGNEALWNSDEGVEALQLIQDVYHEYQLDSTDFLPMADAFGTGSAAFFISQGYWGANFDEDYPDVAGQWSTAITPTFTGELTPSAGLVTPEEGFCVFTTANEAEQEIAFSFIEEMIGSEQRRIDWAVISNGAPDSRNLLGDERIREREQGNSISTQAETLPYRINYGERPLEAEPIWRNMFDRVILEQEDPRAALDEATAEMNNVFANSDQVRLFTERAFTPPEA